MNKDTLVTEFNEIYGVDITESPNDIYFDQSIRVISEAYPKISQGSVISVAGQERYTADVNDIIKLRQIFYNKDVKQHNPSNTNFGTDMLNVLDSSVTQSSIMEAYTNLYTKHLWSKIIPYEANVLDYCNFELLPAPDYDGVEIPYEYEAYRTIEEIPEIFKPILFDLFSFFERDGQYKQALKANNGNNFYFDRRGMGVSETNRKDERQIARTVEYNTIIHNLQTIVNRMS